LNVLPVPVTPLLGRERELEETVRLLAGTRLLTITGAGGSGKTRLALELAHRVAAEFSRVVWVDLAPIGDGGLVAQQILNTLGLRESPTFDDTDLVIEALRGRKHLLILDNCEHVVDGCAVAAEKILRGSADTCMIATTREALGIAGEQTWLVPPMSQDGAAQLFVERARAVLPSFALDDSRRSAPVSTAFLWRSSSRQRA
jgi:predicted ATPase